MHFDYEKNFINGKWLPATEEHSIPMIEPATGESYGSIASSDAKDVDQAVRAARAAFDEGDWGRLSATDRGRLLTQFSAVVRANARDLSDVEARDTGKPKSVADADILALARYFEFYGGAADKFHGEIIPYLPGYMTAVMREAHGVTGHIIPWNYPAQMFGRTLSPALAAGNAVVIKPAEDASATALRLAMLSLEAGFPAGALNVVCGVGSTAGAALASHPGVDYMSFTGSPQVGQTIQKLCAEHYITCTLELGGKSPHIVFADADFESAVPVIVKAITQNAGQTCSAGSRVLVEEAAYDRLIGRLCDAFAKVRAGTPSMDVECGPIITAKQLARVQLFVDKAREDRIVVLAQGTIMPGVGSGGFFVRPTIFGPVPRDHELAREEVFGPVLSILPFRDENDAIALANGTDYGLVAAIWTRDGARQLRLSKRIRAGQIFINCYGAGAGIELPFGGSGKSGHGREKGFAALHDLSKTKTVVINHGV